MFKDPSCTCPRGCRKNFASEEELFILFNNFNHLESFQARTAFIAQNVQEVSKKRCTTSSTVSRKAFTRIYRVNQSRVCKTFFLNLFQISTSRVGTALQKWKSEDLNDSRGQTLVKKRGLKDQQPKVFNMPTCNCSRNCSGRFHTLELQHLFDAFSKLRSYKAQIDFLIQNVREIPKKTSSSKSEKSSKTFTRIYQVGQTIVCKVFFLNLFQISGSRVTTALQSKSDEPQQKIEPITKAVISEENQEIFSGFSINFI